MIFCEDDKSRSEKRQQDDGGRREYSPPQMVSFAELFREYILVDRVKGVSKDRADVRPHCIEAAKLGIEKLSYTFTHPL